MESFYIFAAQKNRKEMKLHSHEEMLDKVIGKKGTAARNDFESRLKAEIDAYQIRRSHQTNPTTAEPYSKAVG